MNELTPPSGMIKSAAQRRIEGQLQAAIDLLKQAKTFVARDYSVRAQDLSKEITEFVGATRSAQTEQQPVATWRGTDWNAQQQLIAHLCKLEPGTDLYAAPIAQTEQQPEQSGLVEPTLDMVQAACAAFRMDVPPMEAMTEALRAALSAQRGETK